MPTRKERDTPAQGDDVGSFILAQRNDSNVALTGTDLDYTPINVDSAGRIKLGASSGVDIGDVDVTSVIPGTGATNLGKAIDSPVGSTDTGILILGVHSSESTQIGVAEEDYDHLHIGELGGLFVEPEQHNHLNEMDSLTGWTVLGDDTTNLLTTTNHLTGTNALTFDKVDGGDDTVFAGIQNTITAVDMGELDLHDIVQTVVYMSSIALVDYVFVRIGTDSSNYNEWRVMDTELTANEFLILGLPIGAANHAGSTGNGVNWAAITYIAVGVAFDAETNTLSGIIFDQLGIFTGAHTTASFDTEVTSSVNTANINLQKVGGSPTDKGAGNASNGSQRIVIATDDINMAIISGAVSGTEMQVDVVAALPAGENHLGSVGGNTVIIDGAITRSGNTTTYTANDVITDSGTPGTIVTFTGCARVNLGSGSIISAVLIDSGNETLKLDGDLFLFDTTVVMDNDNAAWTPTDAELATSVGVISFIGGNARSGLAGTGGNSMYPNAIDAPISFVCLSTTLLFGIFVARNAYIPIDPEVFTFRLGIIQD